MASLWIVVAVAVVTQCVGQVIASCSIRHSQMMSKPPLLLLSNNHTDARAFVASSSTGYTTLAEGVTITLACPGSNNYMFGGNALLLQSVQATCSSGWSFVAAGRTITLNQVECYAASAHDVRPAGTCGEALRLEVGFSVDGAFLALYEVCFDAQTLAAVSATHYVRRGVRVSRTATLSALFYVDVNPAAAYVRTAQTSSFTRQLDSQSAQKYITTANYLEPKLLVPNDDFVYAPQQLAAYFYFNSVPLWKTFHNSYWSQLETSIRTLANSDGDLLVFVAAAGVARLKDSEGVEKPVYLFSKDDDRRIPLPEYLVKSVRNSKLQEVIFLQMWHQNGSSRKLEVQSACAEDVCAQLRWLPWRHVPLSERPVACCRADDPLLRSRIPQLQAHRQGSDPSAGLLAGSAPEEFYAS